MENWHSLQQKMFPTIDGVLILDDVIGLMDEEHFREFGLPHFKELFDKNVSVKFFHMKILKRLWMRLKFIII